ncbi:6925_t:CDS:2, partial [Diversispora eburnea]
MGWSKIISPCSRAREFSEDLFVNNNKLFCKFCNISIGWQNKTTITTYINSKAYKDSCRSYVVANRNDRQQSFHATMVIADGRKQIIHNLGGSIPLADSIRKHHLSGIFEQHYEQLREIFCVDFISQVNNVTVGQLVLKTLVKCEIPFTYPYLIVSDSAAYMKKSVREILQPVMPQIRHNTYCAHIIQLI